MTGTVRWKPAAFAVGAALLAGAALPPAARAFDWKVSGSYNYETGKYGGSVRTDTVYVPVTFKRYLTEKASLALTVPYLSVSGNTRVTTVDAETLQVVSRMGPRTTHSGLGDLVLRGYYSLLEEKPQAFDLTVTGKIKFPTASRSAGLGTGKADEGLGLEFGKRVYGKLTLLADAYYTVIGRPSGLKLRDQTSVDLGFYYPFLKDAALTVLYEESNALLKGNPAPADVRGLLELRASGSTRLFGGLLLGLTKGSSAYGVTAGASHRF